MLGGRSRRSGDVMGVDTRGLCHNRNVRCIVLLAVGALGFLLLWSFLLPSDPTPTFPMTPQPSLATGELHELRTTLSQHKTDISALQQTIAHLQSSLQEATARLAAVPSSQRLDAQESEIKAALLNSLQKSIHGQIDEVSTRTEASTKRLNTLESELGMLQEDVQRLQQASRSRDNKILDVENQLLALLDRVDAQQEAQAPADRAAPYAMWGEDDDGQEEEEEEKKEEKIEVRIPAPGQVPTDKPASQGKRPNPPPTNNKPLPSPVEDVPTLSAPEEVPELLTTEEDDVLLAQDDPTSYQEEAAASTGEEDEEEEDELLNGTRRNGTVDSPTSGHVVVIIPDFGAFADRFSAGESKLGACGTEFTSDEASVDKVLATIEAIDELRDESPRVLSIVLATTPTRAAAFESMGLDGVEIAFADDGLGYGDLCNEAVEEVDDEDATLVFFMPGAVPNTLDFFDALVEPLYHEDYEDVGIVMAKATDFWSGMLSHAGTNVFGNAEDAVPYLQHRGTWPNDERTLRGRFVPVASPYGAWAIPVSVYRAVGGMLSDRDASLTPSLAVYDLCLTVAKEADHVDEDLADDDDDTGVCSLQERHRVYYQPRAVVEVQLEACEEALLSIDRNSEERVEFQERWSAFLWERYLAPQRQSELVVAWDLAADNLAYCHDAVLTLTALDNSVATRVLPAAGTLCVGKLSNEGQTMLTLFRDTDQETTDIDVMITPIQPLDVRERAMQPILRRAGEPRFHVARLLEWHDVELDDDMQEGLEAYDQVWVATEAIRADLLDQGLSADRTHVVPLSVDTYFFDANAMEEYQVPTTARAFIYLSDPSQTVLLSDVQEEVAASREFSKIEEVLIYAPSLAQQGRNVLVDQMGDVKVQVIKEKQSLRELAQLYATTALYVPLQAVEDESAEERLFRLQAQSMGVPVWGMDVEDETRDTILLRPDEVQTLLLQLLQQLEQQ